MPKGFAYTLFVLTVTLSLVTMISIHASSENTIETPSRIRSSLLLTVLNDINDDLSRSSYIATKRAILSLVDYMVTNGTFINDTESAIFYASTTGEYNGSALSLMENTTINDWTVSIQDILGKMGVEGTVTLESYTIRQRDLYNIELATVYELDIYDPISTIRMKRNTTQNVTIDYNSFEDPLNTVKSNLLFSTAYLMCNMSGAYGKALVSETNATNWTVGRVFKSTGPGDIVSLSSSVRAGRILITHNISSYALSDIEEFKGVISETSDDLAGVTIPKIIGTGDACSNTDGSYIAAMSTEIDRWINSIMTSQGTTCFIEHELGPTFFDRMEGNITYGRYSGPGIATFIDPTILPKNPQKELDFVYWSP
ncbi:MAG: hypothetical protein DRN71_00045 [Candidatus Nanohalarchaeota archaeon]|nr:MAG: hypothetical protein DRN71_00045 [Candidatus Nanohaloarchaeota archaeon]